MRIAVITPTIAERADLLRQCIESVRPQTIPHIHCVREDTDHEGCGLIRNQIEGYIPPSYDWLAFIDDDDLMLPDHLATLAAASADADIVYSDCRTEGWQKSWTTRPFDLAAIRQRNYIPVTVLMRRSVFRQVGGFRAADACAVWPEDWDLWLRCASAGARFVYVPEITWVYRRVDASMLTRGY